MTPADKKQQAHHLLEQLDAGQLTAIVQLLQVMTDPVARAIAHAPLDDESLTAEGINALDHSREWRKTNEPVSHEQVLSDFGITQEEIERLSKDR